MASLPNIKIPKLGGGGGNPPIMQFAVLGGGGLLLLAAVYDLDPLQALKNLFSGKNPLDAKYSALQGSITNGSSVVASGAAAPADALNRKQGQGHWVQSGTNAWFWESYYTLAQAKIYVPTTLAAAGNPPGASPPWMFDGQKWLNSSTLTGAEYDPSKTPDSAAVAGGPAGAASSGAAATVPTPIGGSDPVFTI